MGAGGGGACPGNGGGCLEEAPVTGLSQWLFLTGLVVFLPEVGTEEEQV